MKKYIFLIIFFCVFGVMQSVGAEEIDNFRTEIRINQDASINVVETIVYDFGELERHGIYRDIPVKYKARGGNYNLRLEVNSVTDENGRAYNFEVSTTGEYKRIKIGEADRLISGEHVYVIDYEVRRAINYFDSYDELYWNVTGNEWVVAIKNSSAKVWLPEGVEVSQLKKDCLVGNLGSSMKCLNSFFITDNMAQVEAVEFRQGKLNPGEGLTVVVGWPKSLVVKPSSWQNLLFVLEDNGILGLPLVVFLIMFYLWYRRGRDPEGRGTIVPEYTPPANLSPAEIGTIIDEIANKRDVSAEIIYLATQGYLKIVRLEKKGILSKDDFELIKLKEASDLKNEFQKKLFKALFDSKDKVKLSKLKNKFYKDLEEVTKLIYSSSVEKGYFSKSPRKVKGLYSGIAAAIFMLSFILGNIWGVMGIVALISSAVIVFIFGFFMPAKTHEGVLAKEHILGFKDYLSVVEKDRIKFHNAPEKNPETFEKFLPYAMVLKVEEEWAKQFEGIYNRQPSWYNDPTGARFSAIYLANSLGDFRTTANSSLGSRPSSAAGGGSGFSGGFSGGGFGGGGGGSW